MKLSARNRLRGTIVDVKKGTTTSHVRIDVGGQIVTAAITNESVDDLELAAGQTVSQALQDRQRLCGPAAASSPW